MIQKTKVPLKIVYQMSRLIFFPVASIEYKTWKDLDGKPITFHGRGTGTEAIGNIIAKREGITFGDRAMCRVRNWIIAMMNGQIKATVVDLANKNVLMTKAGDRFTCCPASTTRRATSEVFASEKWLADHKDQANIIVEEMLKLYREMKSKPTIIEEAGEAKAPCRSAEGSARRGGAVLHRSGEGGRLRPLEDVDAVAQSDFQFYVEAGQLQGTPGDFKTDQYWDTGPLDAAKKALWRLRRRGTPQPLGVLPA